MLELLICLNCLKHTHFPRLPLYYTYYIEYSCRLFYSMPLNRCCALHCAIQFSYHLIKIAIFVYIFFYQFAVPLLFCLFLTKFAHYSLPGTSYVVVAGSLFAYIFYISLLSKKIEIN